MSAPAVAKKKAVAARAPKSEAKVKAEVKAKAEPKVKIEGATAKARKPRAKNVAKTEKKEDEEEGAEEKTKKEEEGTETKKEKETKKKKKKPTKKPKTEDGDAEVEETEEEEEGAKKKKPAASLALKVADRYKKMTLLESILKRPDTYVGSLVAETETMFVWDEATQRMVSRKILFVPGLFKIFDEILVNAADHRQRDPSMTKLVVEIDAKLGRISVYNNGSGVPVEVHPEYKCYVPELIFGELLTGENYNDEEARTTGGRNGYGAKLANIFSTEFIVETACATNGKSFRQVFTQNMKEKSAPLIKPHKAASGWTRITFSPDFAKFGLTGLDADTIALFTRRVYDMAGTCGKGLKVTLNDKLVEVKSFKDYCALFLPPDKPVAHSKTERWEVVLTSSLDNNFEQVSFVNNISTSKGGQHVAAVTDQVTKALSDHAKKKFKTSTVTPKMVRNHLWVFVNAVIENPRFDSQTKVNMTSAKNTFGSKWTMDEAFLKKAIKLEAVSQVMDQVRLKEEKGMKKTDGKKRGGRVSGIAKLEDANDAGGRNAQHCTLILTEGDSAKALAMSGLSVVGRDRFGVFPLRGKLLNVRDAKPTQITGNAEITHIKQILGLQSGKVYDDASSLRYGHVMIMADQDHDGSHIKGLVVNLFSHFWPSLMRLPGFLTEFITPIVKVSKGRESKSFFTIPEYTNWRNGLGARGTAGWKIKYYKGLGTSTPQEAKEYFSDIDRHKIDFSYSGEEDDKSINLAFAKKLADQRKDWIGAFEPGTYLDQNTDAITYSDFVNKELILFSIASNTRAIPSVVDGFKPGQRKILYSCFKRNLKSEIKVAQLAGYVSEHSSYHHAEASLSGTIVGLAQNFVGNNNINLLYPAGQFGTRAEGGKDAASARYIFTHLCPITRCIFPSTDDHLLTYLDDDGQLIEPEWYMPVLPMVLINGSSGIGTGYSSTVPNFNPRDVVANLRRMMAGDELTPMHPWYKGFKGEIERVEAKRKGTSSYVSRGCVEKVGDDQVRITELPIQRWTTEYRSDVLEAKMKAGEIAGFKEHHTDTTVDFLVTLAEGQMAKVELDLHTYFELTSKINTSNMMLFDAASKIKRYSSPEEIIKDFYPLRIAYYVKRKEWLTQKLENELRRISNKLRFILAVISDELKIRNVKKATIIASLVRDKYDRMPKKDGAQPSATEEATTASAATKEGAEDTEDATADAPEEVMDESKDVAEHADEDGVDGSPASGTPKSTKKAPVRADYDYLLSMALWSLTMEKVDELRKEQADKLADLEKLKVMTTHSMWSLDLEEFSVALDAHEEAERLEAELGSRLKPKKKGAAGRKAPVRRKRTPAATVVPAATPAATSKKGATLLSSTVKAKGKTGGRARTASQAFSATESAPRTATESVAPKAARGGDEPIDDAETEAEAAAEAGVAGDQDTETTSAPIRLPRKRVRVAGPS